MRVRGSFSNSTTRMTVPKRKRNRETLRTGQWTKEEDERLREFIKECGARKWAIAAQRVGTGRNPNQCRERWHNQLRPGIRPTDSWSEEEDIKLLSLYAAYPQKWARIAERMPGRSANQVKNRYKISPLRKFRTIPKQLDQVVEPTVVIGEEEWFRDLVYNNMTMY